MPAALSVQHENESKAYRVFIVTIYLLVIERLLVRGTQPSILACRRILELDSKLEESKIKVAYGCITWNQQVM